MGRDKALVEVGGRPLALIAAEALWSAGATRVVAVGGDASALATLGLEVEVDRHPGAGPLGALLGAFAAARTDIVVVLACDLPEVDAASVALVFEALLGDSAAAVARPEQGGRHHVLHAAWRVSAAGPVLAAAFAAGERSPRRAAAALPRRPVAGVSASALRNANRPQDLRTC